MRIILCVFHPMHYVDASQSSLMCLFQLQLQYFLSIQILSTSPSVYVQVVYIIPINNVTLMKMRDSVYNLFLLYQVH